MARDLDAQRSFYGNYPELEFCAQCRDHAVFAHEDEEGEDLLEWLSSCCGAPAMPVDVELDIL